MKKKVLKIVLFIILALVVAIAGAGFMLVKNYTHADKAAELAMESDKMVRVEHNGDWINFVPDNPVAGLVFYPDNKVEAAAYAPLMRSLAAQRILCVAVDKPLKLATMNMDSAGDVIAAYPGVEKWYIAGHALGGTIAADFAADNADKLNGVILLASYSKADLSGTGLKVLSIYGSNDEIFDMNSYNENKANLGECTEKVIEGGNHAYFGSYGEQKGDGLSDLTAKEQVSKTTLAIRKWMAK